MRIANISKKAYTALNKSKPGPSLSTLQKEQSDIFVQEGFIEAIKPFLIHMQEQPGWTEKDSICSIDYDELKLEYIAMLDTKNQRVVGPNSYGLLVTVRGLVSDWSYPIFNLLDKQPTKEDLFMIIKWLHDINLTCILATCDQGINFVHCLSKRSCHLFALH